MTTEELKTFALERVKDYLWKYNYAGHSKAMHPIQVRDLIRTFYAGILDALLLVNIAEATLFIPVVKELTNPNWLPGPEFYPDDSQD